MPIYHSLGQLPPKRHIAFRSGDGALYHEHLIGNFGFNGPSSLLYHLRPPTTVTSAQSFDQDRLEGESSPVHGLRHFRTGALPKGGSPTLNRTPILFNDDVVLSHVSPDKQDEHFFRNGTGDELIVVAKGAGVLQSQFGEIPYAGGDQLIIPRGVLYRLELDPSAAHRLFVLESRGFLRTPGKYRTEFGQLKEGAPFSERAIKRPGNLVTNDQSGDFRVIYKHAGGLNEVHLDHHPLDVVGWDGYYYPWAVNIGDFEPIVGAIHQPPPVHQLLESDNMVYCNFCPRPFDFHPGAVPAPYNHSNVMTDEVLIYLSEEFMSRKGIEYGSITLHPDGMPHGPHPGMFENSIGKARTEEIALMLDTFRPLMVSRQAIEIEDKSYYKSWAGGQN